MTETSFPLELNGEDRVKGNLTILEGTQGIKIYLETPHNELVYDGGVVYNSLDFTLNVQSEGIHRLYLANLDPINQQKFQLSLTINQFPWFNSILIVSIGLLVSITGIVIIFFNISRK